MLKTPSATRRRRLAPQTLLAAAGAAVLEILFLAMARLGDLALHVIATIALGLAAGLVYLIALYALEHSGDSRPAFWVILAAAVVFRLTLVPLPPSLSTDLYRYQWDGRVQSAGWNPYTTPPDDPRLISMRDRGWSVMPLPGFPATYPPLSELVFRYTTPWIARPLESLTGGRLPAPAAFKMPFVLADLLVVAMLAGWLRNSGGRNFQLAVYAWSPLVVVEFAASGHNDALAIAALLLALLIIRRAPGVSTVALTGGALAKLFPAALVPLALRRAGWPRRGNGWVAVMASVALAGACAWPYRSAIGGLSRVVATYRLAFQNFNASLYALLLRATGHSVIAAGLGEGVVLGLALWAAARSPEPGGESRPVNSPGFVDPVRAAFLILSATLMLAPNTYSWYFTWIVPLLCFFPHPAWLLLTVLQFLSYKVLIDYQALGIWHFDRFFAWLIYAPFYAWLIAGPLIRKLAGQPAGRARP